MTCIVGVKYNGHVYIGGDSAGGNGVTTHTLGVSKVFRNGEFLIGIQGCFAFGQMLQFEIDFPKQESQSDMRYLCTKFVNTIRENTKEDNSPEPQDTLFGYRGGLYILQRDLSILPCLEHSTLGSGGDHAEGALLSTTGMLPVPRIRKALEAAAQVCNGVKPPFKILCL